MRNILLVTSSLWNEQSKSRQVALDLVGALRAADPGVRVTVRDANAIPHLSAERLTALATAPDSRGPSQQVLAAAADAIIEEVEAADTIVITAPMYNFSISSALKAWIDHLARAGRTFRYTATGPEGLLKGKRVFVVTSRGGFYAGDGAHKAMDFQEPYLRAVLGFVGLQDVAFIHAEGQAIGGEAAAKGLEAARAEIARLVPTALVA